MYRIKNLIIDNHFFANHNLIIINHLHMLLQNRELKTGMVSYYSTHCMNS